MTLNLVTGPAVQPLMLQEAKAHLRVDHEDEDALIDALIVTATQSIDGRDGWLGRALITQTWDLTLHRFPGWRARNVSPGAEFPYRYVDGPIMLKLPPVQSITSITYVDTDGNTQTFDSTKYRLSAEVNGRPRVDLEYGEVWPDTRDEPDAVTVRFVAGYGDVGSDVPQPIRQAELITIGHYYENRQIVNIGAPVQEIPMTAQHLLAPYRVWGF